MTVAQAREGLRILEQAGDRKEVRKLKVRIQEKFSFPAICLVFGLIGASLGARPNGRTSRSQGFGISVLLIFLYYLLAFVFSSLGVKVPFHQFCLLGRLCLSGLLVVDTCLGRQVASNPPTLSIRAVLNLRCVLE